MPCVYFSSDFLHVNLWNRWGGITQFIWLGTAGNLSNILQREKKRLSRVVNHVKKISCHGVSPFNCLQSGVWHSIVLSLVITMYVQIEVGFGFLRGRSIPKSGWTSPRDRWFEVWTMWSMWTLAASVRTGDRPCMECFWQGKFTCPILYLSNASPITFSHLSPLVIKVVNTIPVIKDSFSE